jgi:hypothetical protein
MTDRVTAAWADPRALWAIILEDEDTADVAELGEIAEHLYADAAQARAETARLRAEVHSLAGQLRRASVPADPAGSVVKT